jgi:hypothetical protein
VKQLSRQREHYTLRALVKAIGDDAVAAAVAPGLERHAEPFRDPLGAPELTVIVREEAFSESALAVVP